MKAFSSVNTVPGIADIVARPIHVAVVEDPVAVDAIQEQPQPLQHQIKRPRMRDGYWLTDGRRYPYTNSKRGEGLGKDAGAFLSRVNPTDLGDETEHVHAALTRIQQKHGAVSASDIQGILDSWHWTRSELRSIAEGFNLTVSAEVNIMLSRESLGLAIYDAL